MNLQNRAPELTAPPSGATVAAPAAPSSPDLEQCPKGRSGQRELCLPRGINYPLVVFTGFEFVG